MDAHDREYAAAAASIHEQTPRQRTTYPEPAVGDFVSGTTDGRFWSGHVEWVERGWVCINVGGGWVSVPLHDLTH